ncbi:MAG: ATP-binding protein [Bacteroidota bacterium]
MLLNKEQSYKADTSSNIELLHSWEHDLPFRLYRLQPSGVVVDAFHAQHKAVRPLPRLQQGQKLQEHYEEHKELINCFRQVVEEGEKASFMLFFGDRFYTIFFHPIQKNGETTSVYMILTDAQENIEMQDEVIRKINYFEKIQHVGRVGIVEVNFDKQSVFWSDQTYKIYGVPPHTQPSVELGFGLIHDEDIHYTLAEYYEAIANVDERLYRLQYRVVTPEGKTRYIELHGEIIRDSSNQAVRSFGIVRDVTSESRFRELLQDGNQKLHNILESLTEGFLAVNKQGRITNANRAIARVMGYEPANLIGRMFADPRLLTGDDFWQEQYEEAVREERSLTVFEWFHPKLETWWEIKIRSIPEGHSVLFDEIHARKTLAESLKEINAAKDRLFSIIAHDLRGPLNSISGILELYENFGEHMTREELEELLAQTRKASTSAQSLLEDLLTWSRNEMGATAFKPTHFSAATLINRVLNQKAVEAANKSIKLRVHIDEAKHIYGDPNMIGTVIRNFVDNAIKFTPHGGEISIHLKTFKKTDLLVVWDTGVGMDESAAKELFRIDKKTKTIGTAGERGTGLGLKICKQLIEKHQGEIYVRSQPDKGSAFTVMLPKKEMS